jgi:hypothetical protein
MLAADRRYLIGVQSLRLPRGRRDYFATTSRTLPTRLSSLGFELFNA